jgi:hypothetical protein
VSSLSPSWKEHGCTLSIPKAFEVGYTYEWWNKPNIGTWLQ